MMTSWRSSRYSLLSGIPAVVAGCFAVLAAVWPDWLETFGVHWDYGDGALEWAVPLAMAVIAAALGARAARRWRVDFARVVRARG